MTEQQGDQAFQALADRTRRAILALLADRGESSVGVIAGEVTTVGRTAISSQLKVLRSAGLVRVRRSSRFRLYSLAPGATDGVIEFLARLHGEPISEFKRRVEGGTPAGRAPRKAKPVPRRKSQAAAPRRARR